MNNPYRPSGVSIDVRFAKSRRYIHSVTAFASCLVLVPAALYSVTFALVGSDIRFSTQPSFWVPLLLSSVIAAIAVYPFQGTRIWVATLVGLLVGLTAFGLYFAWLDW
jgi:hypothetical protein